MRAAQDRHGRVIRVQRQAHPSFLGHRHHLSDERAEALLDLLVRNGRQDLAGILRVKLGHVVNHVPNHAGRNGRLNGVVEADRNGLAAGVRPGHLAPHPGHAEVVAHGRNANPAHIADELFELLHLLWPARTVEQHVVPLRRRKILQRLQLQALRVDQRFQVAQPLVGPDGVVGVR